MRSIPMSCVISTAGALLWASCATTNHALQEPSAAPPERRIDVLLGARSFDEDDWAPVEDQGVLGVAYAQQFEGMPLMWDAGLDVSYADDSAVIPGPLVVDVEATFVQAHAGLIAYWEFGEAAIRPYAGAALALLSADAKVSSGGASASESDTTIAPLFRIGAQVRAGESLSLAVEWRSLIGAEFDIAGVDVDGDYGQLAVLLGFSL